MKKRRLRASFLHYKNRYNFLFLLQSCVYCMLFISGLICLQNSHRSINNAKLCNYPQQVDLGKTKTAMREQKCRKENGKVLYKFDLFKKNAEI